MQIGLDLILSPMRRMKKVSRDYAHSLLSCLLSVRKIMVLMDFSKSEVPFAFFNVSL